MGTKDIISESSIERALAEGVKAAGGKCLKLAALWDTGIPDRLCLFKGARAVFVELKAPGKRPRKIQEASHRALRALGFPVEVVDTKEGAKSLVERYCAQGHGKTE